VGGATVEITEAIKQTLHDIEQQEGVRILYACESGSRAWGFASQDSDYDVRFIYARPADAYLRLDAPRDVIERPIVGELDVNGWDIFKALRLLRGSNPPLLEWLFSPIVYQEDAAYIAELRTIARRYYSPAALYYHYGNMASRNYQQYLAGKPEVALKKYLYVLRPLIAILFLQQQGQLPSTNFLDTLAHVELAEEIRASILDLVARKQSATELGTSAPNPLLDAFINERLAQWGKQSFETPDKQEMTLELEQVLARILAEG